MLDIVQRPRRLRRTAALRSLVQETRLAAEDFILPLFVCAGKSVRRAVSSMPGVFNLSIDEAVRETEAAFAEGIKAVILFGLPETKDAEGTGAFDENGIVQQAARAIKRAVPEMVVVADCCLCEYTAHGHCGAIDENGEVLNDQTLRLLANTAVSQAQAGADIIAPSAMMDGQVAAIRRALDESSFAYIPIMSYAVKFASAFYGPFREAADSAPAFGDRRAYQMDAANFREAMREAALDAAEGADFLMVKPATAYLDLVYALRQKYDLPIAAYHVSGEYAMIKAAAERGWIDEKRVMLETLTAIKRAGADLIITYFAREAARALKEKS
ncbi:MAG TPA: porphobilinogen synthase [Pyrinomonadaceae bacterium]|nr:porphobilinogen synthase [Pyrinomonadaceae bacterium]